MKALILAGSEVTTTPALKTLCGGADLVIAADSGVRHATPLGVTPDLIVGDFDSATAEDLARYPQVPKQTHPPRKDWLDLELALTEALARSASELLLVGVLGGRLDQTLAALFIAARARQRVSVTLHDGHSAAYPLKAGDVLSLPLPMGTPFSVLSLEPVSIISLGGASYPLREARLPFGVGLGVSNETIADTLDITLHEGLALLLLEFQPPRKSRRKNSCGLPIH